MKILSIFLLSAIISATANAQDVKQAASKMDAFASKTGVIVKFIDYSLPNMSLTYGTAAEAKVRKIISGNDVGFFYQVSAKGQYGEKTGSIAFTDLIDVIKALETLKAEAVRDMTTDGEYLEHKFVTSDGFQLGYYVSKGKAKWYMVLEKYGSDNTIFLNDVSTIESSLLAAKKKIEELQNS